MNCPNCESADTVSYWDIKANQGDSIITTTYKAIYPSARKCVDCSLVWWTDQQMADVRETRQREPEEPTLMPCPPCPDCGHLHRLSKCAACTCTNKEWR